MVKDGVSIATSQSLAIRDFTYKIDPDTFPCNKTEKNKNECNTETQTSDQGDREVNKSSV